MKEKRAKKEQRSKTKKKKAKKQKKKQIKPQKNKKNKKMIEDFGKRERFRGVVEDLVEEEMHRLRAFAELVSQNTLYRMKTLVYTPRVASFRAPALVDEFLARCAAEGYDVKRSKKSQGRCVLRVHVVGCDEGERNQSDRGENCAQKPHARVEGPRCKSSGGGEVLHGPSARPQVAEV